MDYRAAQKLFVKHKGALTRARKKGPEAVLAAVEKFYAEFDDVGFPLPDAWHTWNIAKEDAEMELRRKGTSW